MMTLERFNERLRLLKVDAEYVKKHPKFAHLTNQEATNLAKDLVSLAEVTHIVYLDQKKEICFNSGLFAFEFTSSRHFILKK